MAERQAPAKPIATRSQLLTMVVLGVSLIVVLVVQFGGDSSVPKREEIKNGSPRTISAAQAAAPKRTPATGQSNKATASTAGEPWPKFTAATASQYDPFIVPEPLVRRIAGSAKDAGARKQDNATAKRATNAANVAALRSKGTSAVVHTDHGAMAVLGNRVVRVGDMVEGYRVETIDLQGIVLAPAERQESHEERK